MEEDIKVIDLLELGKAVWKFKYFIVGCAIVGGVLGYGYAYKTVTPLYPGFPNYITRIREKN